MGRFLAISAGLAVLFILGNQGLPSMQGLEDKFWLVALLPSVYILGLAMLRD